MHRLAPLPAAPSTGRPVMTPVAMTICLVFETSLDADAFGYWLERGMSDVRVVAASCDDGAWEQLATLKPDLAIVEAGALRGPVERGLAWHREAAPARLLLLDRTPREAIMLAALRQPGVSYLSRRTSPEHLRESIEAILGDDQRVFDAAFAGRLRRTSRGIRLAPLPGGSVAGLSQREIEVWRTLAGGLTVSEAAVELKLAESTIDNHRSRLMRKLHLHKAALLARRAIADGVIEP